MSDGSPLRVLISAAASGVGRVIAQRFHSHRAKVAACDVDETGLESLVRECPGMECFFCDAGDEASIVEGCEVTRTRLGGIDVLVNNVGVAGPTAAAEDVSLDAWDETLRINLTSHFLFARAVIPTMKAHGAGLIVNISSGSAKVGLPLRLPYVVSKGALQSMTMNLARELGPSGIRVNAILPGPVRGDRIRRVIREKASALEISEARYEQSLTQYTSLRTLVEPDDIASMVCFLASDGGVRVSGQCIGVDGNLEWEE